MNRPRSIIGGAMAALALAAGVGASAAAPVKQPPAIVQESRRRGKRKSEKAKKDPTRREQIAALVERLETYGTSWQTKRELREQIAALRLRERNAKGRLGRRMRRGRVWGIGHATRLVKIRSKGMFRAPEQSMHVDGRIPRRIRAEILRADGRPVSGRQWKKFAKSARRKEREFRAWRRQAAKARAS